MMTLVIDLLDDDPDFRRARLQVDVTGDYDAHEMFDLHPELRPLLKAGLSDLLNAFKGGLPQSESDEAEDTAVPIPAAPAFTVEIVDPPPDAAPAT